MDNPAGVFEMSLFAAKNQRATWHDLRIASSFALLLAVVLTYGSASADDWPQWLGLNRDGVWRETGILEKFPEGGPKICWRPAIGGAYSGPAVASGRVFVTDRQLAPKAKNPASGFQRGEIP